MIYIDAIKGSGIALIIFVLAVVVLPSYGGIGDFQTVLTVSTFLFAIVAGFYMARMNSKYDRIRETVATEDALWLSLYYQAKMLGKSFENTVRELIDKYYIVAYDFSEFNDYYKYNANYYLSIYDEMDKLSKNKKSEAAFDKMLETMKDIEGVRNTTSVFNLEKVNMGQWAVLIVLAAIVTFSMFFIKTQDFVSQTNTVLLSTVMVLVILTIRDLQNQRLGGAFMLVESGQEVLEFMGKPRYYPERYLKDGSMKVPFTIKKYRLGTHKKGQPFKIKIISTK